MKRHVAAGLLGLTVLLGNAKPAQAELFEFWASGLVGGAWGNGETDRDFFSSAGGGAGGVEIGARILFIGAYIDYLRFFGGDTGAHLVGFNLGGDGDVGLTDNLSLVFRLAGTFYLGSLDDADVVPDLSTVETRGVGVRGGVGLRYTFFKFFSVGTTPQLGYHYFFAGADEDITDTDQNSSGWDLQVLGYLRASIGI